MTGGRCRFGVLGPLVLERDGQTVPLPSGRQRSLLALLILNGSAPLSRDRLIDELWGEHPPASAVSAVHVHLSKLRSLLGGLLVLGAAGYVLRPGDFEVDLWQFEELVQQARADPQRAGRLLGEALGLFRGEPLCDVVSEGSVAQWRRTVEEKRLQAILLRLDAELAAGAAGELVAELQQLADQHPFEERVWGQLMLALYSAGRQAESLEAYQRARRRFAEELGLEPGAQLVRLQARILEQDPSLRATARASAPASMAPVSPATPAACANLPRAPTPLVGREHALTALQELTADPHLRIITLTGPGGVGKTRLLLEVAQRLEPRFADGAVFVRLERLTDPALVAAEIAGALAQRDRTDTPSADGLGTYLRDRELLLAVDNFEHLLAAAALIAELLALAPGIRFLVSSRAPLRIRGEQTFGVQPLRLPEGESEAELAGSPAVQLFVQRAAAADRALAIDATTMPTVARICRALDGLPLAIELAASRSHSLTPAQIADQLAQPLLIGENALRDLPDRQQTLQATIRWSYELLGGEARAVLCAAATFLGGFTLLELEAVAGGMSRLPADELLEASLIRRQPADGRFELLELVRAFALVELEASGRGAETSERHRRHFAAHIATASAAFDAGGAPGELAAPLLADHANLRAALENAIETGDEESALALALGLRPLWIAGMLRQESQELADRLLQRFALPGEAEVALLRAVAFLDYTASAKGWHQRLAAAATRIGDREALALATGNLFGQALNARDRDEMKRLRPSLRALITPKTSPRALGWTNYFLALDAYVDGQMNVATAYAAVSVEQAEQIGHEVMLASAAGAHLLSQSARDGVIAHGALTEAVELMRRPSVQPLSAVGLWLVARYAVGTEPETAGRWLAHAERIVEAIDVQLWPESVLRDEAIAVLGLADLAPLLAATLPLDHAAALAEAAAWLDGRDPEEEGVRVVAGLLGTAVG